MPSVTFVFTRQFTEDVMKGVHDFSADTFKLALVNSAGADTNSALADLTEISYTNLSSRTLAGVTAEQTTGVAPLTFTDHVLTASGGAVAAFRTIYVYNDTSTGDKLVGYWDYGSSLTLADTNFLTIDGSASGMGTISRA
jgi:hypothetical protein